jgi:hypothetical protein
MTLLFHRDDGKQEQVHLNHETLPAARDLAESVLRIGYGLYVKVELYVAGRVIETIEYARHEQARRHRAH